MKLLQRNIFGSMELKNRMAFHQLPLGLELETAALIRKK